MMNVEAIRNAQRADGPATIMAIGTATPPNVVEQSAYPDDYFRVTNSDHMVELKEKFRSMCKQSMIKKRHLYLTEEILKENQNMCAFSAPSLDARLDMIKMEVPLLGKEAALKAIKEWGQPKSKITHLVFCTSIEVNLHAGDQQLVKLLGLSMSTKRVKLYSQSCNGGGTVLRVAKDLAENNKGARVLVVCSEITAIFFRGPIEAHLDNLEGQAIFGDGAAALIIGADPIKGVEKPIFEIALTAQTIIPDSEEALKLHVREEGVTFNLRPDVHNLISKNIEMNLVEAFKPLGITDWNSIFWVPQPIGPAILDQMEVKLHLKPEKFRATRSVLREYGNLLSPFVLFILDEMRKSSAEEGKRSTGEGKEWGVLFGFGAGLTVETVVLHSVAI